MSVNNMLLLLLLCLLAMAGCQIVHPYTYRVNYSLDELESVNRKVNNDFEYISDIELYGRLDYWATPQEFIDNRGGDCEDFAIYKNSLLNNQGEYWLVIDRATDQAHAVLVIDNRYVLDQRMGRVITVSSARFRSTYDVIMQKIRVKYGKDS